MHDRSLIVNRTLYNYSPKKNIFQGKPILYAYLKFEL